MSGRSPSEMKSILDANALMVPYQFGVDIFAELERLGYYDWLVPRAVLQELRNIASSARKGRDRTAARVALALAARCRAVGDEEEDADQSIEDLACLEGAAVFTNDRALKKRLFNKGISVIYLRQGRYLEASKKEC